MRIVSLISIAECAFAHILPAERTAAFSQLAPTPAPALAAHFSYRPSGIFLPGYPHNDTDPRSTAHASEIMGPSECPLAGLLKLLHLAPCAEGRILDSDVKLA